MKSKWSVLLFLVCISCGSDLPREVGIAYDALDRDIDFNQHVRPILSDRCYSCHGPDEAQREGDLRLDLEEGLHLKLSDGRPAIIKGNATQSKLIERILHHDPEFIMPPPKSNLTLNANEKATLIKWVEQGAIWENHWAYIRPEKKPFDGDISPIDHFVLQKLDQQGLAPSPPTDQEKLIRRLSLDLIGLPPTKQETTAFVEDRSHDAYERLVDRLLESKHFGERWAWHWLDIARYADTNGFQGDPTRKMWPWRDWVVQAFDDNMPYDQFTVEQLAGDMLPDATEDQILATAFNRNHMYNGEGGRIPEETRVENVFDRVETMGTVWLGLTLNCCRCHDHKFDDISQKEYYQFFDYFNQTTEGGNGRNGRVPPVLDLSGPIEQAKVADIKAYFEESAAELDSIERIKFPRAEGPASLSDSAAWLNGHEAFALSLYPTKRESYLQGLLINTYKKRDPLYTEALSKMRKATNTYNRATGDNLQVMVMDHLEVPRPTFVLNKGAYDKQEDQVSAAIPAALPAVGHEQVDDRLDLAEWLVDPDHPLTARVTVNRFWQELFGVGLVKTVEDFGLQGALPSHPHLLDWLARDFVDHGWDIKRLLKMMVMSKTYQQSSKVTKELLEVDPENLLLSRAPRHRMHSWMLRDQALHLSGLLVDSAGGPAVKPYQPPGIWAEATFGKKSYDQDHGDDLYRKSLYIFWRRIVSPTMFFDNASRQVCTVKPTLTNTPLHALTTLNDVTYVEAARVWAQRLLQDLKPSDAIAEALQAATNRSINDSELQTLVARYNKLLLEYGENLEEAEKLISIGEYPRDTGLDPASHAALTQVCNLILNLDEVLTKE